MKRSALVAISVGLLNLIHGGTHLIQFIQSVVLIEYAHLHDESIYGSLLWAFIGIVSLIVGVKDFRHHSKCNK